MALQRIPIRIQKFQFAQSEFADGRLDFGPITDHYPNHVVGMNGRFGGIGHVGGSQRPNLRGVGLIVIVRQPNCTRSRIDAPTSFMVSREPAASASCSFARAAVLRRPAGRADDVVQFFVYLRQGFLGLVGLHRRVDDEWRWPRASSRMLCAPYDQCLSSRRFMLMRDANVPPRTDVHGFDRDFVRLFAGGAISPARMIDCSAPGLSIR